MAVAHTAIAYAFAQIQCLFYISFSFTGSHAGLHRILQVMLNIGGHIHQNNMAFKKIWTGGQNNSNKQKENKLIVCLKKANKLVA